MLPRAAGAGGSSTHNLHAFVCTRPEPFRQLNEPTMDWPYILVILGIAVILYLIGSLRVLRQYERGVVFLLGKFEGVRGPGLTIIFVPIQQMVRVSLRTVTMQIPSQKIITKDNVSIDIAAVAYYHISDPEKAVIVIENVYNAINQISQTTVRNVVGRFSLDQLLSDTASINEQIKNVIDRHTEPWGTQVTAVEIKDIVLPDNMQRAMAKEAEAERERRAKIVAAEGEYQAAMKLGQAADIITEHPDDGGNLGRKELNHHLPCTIYDDGAGSYRALVKEQHLNSLEKGCSCKSRCKSVSKMRNRQRPSAQQLDMRWSGWRNTNTALPGVVLPSSRRVRSTATVPSIVSTSG
jgi:regulator of protease activity HflC (stomatin/prohibitin superfamily)